jgi:beta-glucosidase
VSVQVTNTGRYAGDEVVQLYIRDQASSVTRPVKELKGFRRMKLQAGETQSVEFVIGRDQLAFFDEHMKRTVEPGLFDVMVGTNSLEVQTIQLEVVK